MKAVDEYIEKAPKPNDKKLRVLVKKQQVVVSALVLNQTQDKILLSQRLSGSFIGGYQTPGGGVEISDGTLLTALWRELQEETGLQRADFCPHISVFTETLSFTSLRDSQIEHEAHYVAVTLAANGHSPKHKEPEENGPWEWWPLAASGLPLNLTPMTAYGVALLRQKLAAGTLIYSKLPARRLSASLRNSRS
jgi:8-oxo-dGTP pyrophosphatase MutT (NUDIX family)